MLGGAPRAGVQLARGCRARSTVLAVALNVLTQAVALGGEFGTAARADRRGRRRHRGDRHAGRAVRRARAGRLSRPTKRRVPKLIDATIRRSDAPAGREPLSSTRSWAKAVLLNGLGRYGEALAAAAGSQRRHARAVRLDWALIELIEAAARSGDAELAAERCERLAEHVRRARQRLGARRRGPLARAAQRGRRRRELYREAIERLGRTPAASRARPRAPSLRRVAAAREPARRRARPAPHGPRAVHAIGMEAFAERARMELLGDRREGPQADASRRATS